MRVAVYELNICPPQSYHDLALTLYIPQMDKVQFSSITTAAGESAVFPDIYEKKKKKKYKT